MDEFTSVFKSECKLKYCYYQENKKPKCDDNTLDLANGNTADGFFYLLGKWTLHFLTLAVNQVKK